MEGLVSLAIPLNKVYNAGRLGRSTFALLVLFITFDLLGRKLMQTGGTLLQNGS